MRQLHYDREMDYHTYAQYSYRSVRYDMWYKLRFFRDMMHKDTYKKKKRDSVT